MPLDCSSGVTVDVGSIEVASIHKRTEGSVRVEDSSILSLTCSTQRALKPGIQIPVGPISTPSHARENSWNPGHQVSEAVEELVDNLQEAVEQPQHSAFPHSLRSKYPTIRYLPKTMSI